MVFGLLVFSGNPAEIRAGGFVGVQEGDRNALPSPGPVGDPGGKAAAGEAGAGGSGGGAQASPIEFSLGIHRDELTVGGFSGAALGLLRDLDPLRLGQLVVVRVAGGTDAMAGRVSVGPLGLSFTPAFPFAAGLEYQVTLAGDGIVGLPAELSSIRWVGEAMLPRREPGEPTRLVSLFPSGDVLPANLLKLYLHFSAPMSRGVAWDHLAIVDEQGREVELAILELEHELWDPSSRRLTVLFDPGRIKSDLLPKKVAGPIFVAGREYALVLSGAWPDAQGRPLGDGLRRGFEAGPVDHDSPVPANWRLVEPDPGVRSPLIVTFDERLDAALALRMIHLEDAAGVAVAGESTLGPNELSWSFQPTNPWTAGNYRVVVDGRLEDLAGNSVARPFEVDLHEERSEPELDSIVLEIAID